MDADQNDRGHSYSDEFELAVIRGMRDGDREWYLGGMLRAVLRCISGCAAMVTVALAPADHARACSLDAHEPHPIDPSMQSSDRTPPALAPLPDPEIKRGAGPERSGCSSSASSCDDLGYIALTLSASDELTPPQSIGYRLTLVAGQLPAGFVLPIGAVEPRIGRDRLTLGWADGDTDDQEALDFTLEIVAVDLAGNESEPQRLRVRDPGSGGGCGVGPGRHSGATPGALAVLVLIVASSWRRRPSAG